MDITSANTGLWRGLMQLALIAGAFLMALLLLKLPVLKKSLMPAAVLGGFLLLAFRYAAPGILDRETMEVVTFHGMAAGFAALALRIPKKSQSGTALKSGGLIGAAFALQGALGLLVSLVVSRTLLPAFFPAAGLLLPMGYAQGPGQAGNIGAAFERLGFEGGRSFGLSIAAAGYLSACIVGVIYLNILKRNGKLKQSVDANTTAATTNHADTDSAPSATSAEEPLTVQIALVVASYFLGFLLLCGLDFLVKLLKPETAQFATNMLWGFHFILASMAAKLLGLALRGFKKAGLLKKIPQNNRLLGRISNLAFDFMIVAAIASIDIAQLKGLLPFVLMNLLGAAATFFYLHRVCPQVYPGYPTEGFLAMFGTLTGTVSSGILLLRESDPKFRTPASNDLLSGSILAGVFALPVIAAVFVADAQTAIVWAVAGALLLYCAGLTVWLTRKKRAKE
ncbi:MAG: hypothetical protein LBT21_02400 [Oscillospiraceae bacterium]|jgi:ESS family glutamate:Na+ symporter|nr:hypothetical protein [Oscillospiraceae bacterium]